MTDSTVRKNTATLSTMPCHLPDTCLQSHPCSEPLSLVPSPNLMAVGTVALCGLTSCCGHSKPCVPQFSLGQYSLLHFFPSLILQVSWEARTLFPLARPPPKKLHGAPKSNSHASNFILSALALMPEVCVPTPLSCSSIPFELSLVLAL